FVSFASHSGGFLSAITQRSLQGDERVVSIIGGHHLFFINNSYLICLVWLLIDRNAARATSFWFILASLILLGYLVSGSRSGVLNKALVIGYAYLMVIGSFNMKKVALLLVPLSVLIGYQSANRFVKAEDLSRRTFSEQIYSSVEGVRETFEEAAARGGSENSSFGLYLNVSDRFDYQYGYTYSSILFIPIPSALLPFEKPSAAGYHYVNPLTGRTDTAWPIGSI